MTGETLIELHVGAEGGSALRIVAVHGSARRGGNTDILLERAMAGAREEGAEVRLIRAAELRIAGCRGCEGCRNTGRCVQQDDMQGIYDDFLASGGYIFATPIYGWGPSGQIKLFLDRLYAIVGPLQRRDRKDRKYAALITAFGASDPSTADETVRMFRKICRHVRVDFLDELRVTAQEKGEVLKKPSELAKAEELGRELAHRIKEIKAEDI